MWVGMQVWMWESALGEGYCVVGGCAGVDVGECALGESLCGVWVGGCGGGRVCTR